LIDSLCYIAAAEIAEMQKSGKLTDDNMMDTSKENNTPPPSKQTNNLINLQS
jgi:hypothetical protein